MRNFSSIGIAASIANYTLLCDLIILKLQASLIVGPVAFQVTISESDVYHLDALGNDFLLLLTYYRLALCKSRIVYNLVLTEKIAI